MANFDINVFIIARSHLFHPCKIGQSEPLGHFFGKRHFPKKSVNFRDQSEHIGQVGFTTPSYLQ